MIRVVHETIQPKTAVAELCATATKGMRHMTQRTVFLLSWRNLNLTERALGHLAPSWAQLAYGFVFLLRQDYLGRSRKEYTQRHPWG